MTRKPLSRGAKKIFSCALFLAIFFAVFFCLVNDSQIRIIFAVAGLLFLFIFIIATLMPEGPSYWQTITLLIGFCVTIIGWFTSSYFNNIQSRANSQRELRTKYLIDAYMRLANGANRDSESMRVTYIYWKYTEPAVEAASMLGDTGVIRKMNQFALTKPGTPDWNSRYLAALYELRYDLRRELGLTPISRQMTTLDADSDFNIVFLRRFATDSIKKLDSPFYDVLQTQIAIESVKNTIGH
jgi:hypothetical protein